MSPTLPPPLEPLRWDRSGEPTAAGVADLLRGAGVSPSTWSNGAHDRYAAHDHPFTKLLMCAAGSITFLVGRDEAAVELAAGDGFVLPAGTRHAAIVGPDGCTCVEGHR